MINDSSTTLEKASKLVEENKGPLDRVGKARGVLKTILALGEAAAEVGCLFIFYN